MILIVTLLLQALREDLENNRPVLQNLLSMSEALIGVCHELSINNDVVMVTSEVEEVKRRWEALTAKVVGGEKELKNSNKTLALVHIIVQQQSVFIRVTSSSHANY